MAPETRYAKTGDIHIAYQVVGDGPVDIVLAAEFWHSIEVQWDQPDLAAFLEHMASFSPDLLRPARERSTFPAPSS